MLLDTGLRASELCSLLIEDLDMNTGKVTIKHGVTGGAKGKRVVLSIWIRLQENRFGDTLPIEKMVKIPKLHFLLAKLNTALLATPVNALRWLTFLTLRNTPSACCGEDSFRIRWLFSKSSGLLAKISS